MYVAGQSQYNSIVRHWNTTSGPNRLSQQTIMTFLRNNQIVYDTGAMTTTMTPALLRAIGEDPDRTTNVGSQASYDANRNRTVNKVLKGVTIYFLIQPSRKHVKSARRPSQWVKVVNDVAVVPSSLVGVDIIKKLSRYYKVKFK